MPMSNKYLPSFVKIMEVGPRDGLQNEARIVDTINKIKFIEQLVDAGIKRIEVTAFVSPRWIPPLADQLEVALGVQKKPGVTYAALVPNVRGYDRAIAAQIDEVSFVIAASQTHNQKNLNATTPQVLDRYREVIARAHADKKPFRTYISCAFGCPYEGEANVAEVMRLSQEFLALGAYEIVISDTIGGANPLSTENLLKKLLAHVPKDKVALHFHDTRGMALANVYVALTMGIASFDASAGGMGGCPYAPGASGNVATEDLVNMLSALGIETGIDIPRLCRASLDMEDMLEKRLPSKILAVMRGTRT